MPARARPFSTREGVSRCVTYESRLCVSSGCARSRATTTVTGSMSVSALSTVAWLTPLASASVRRPSRNSGGKLSFG